MKRYYSISLISYLSKSKVDGVLKAHLKDIRRFAYILHDKDTKEDGTLKEPHFHILLYTYNAHSISAFRKWFRGDQNTLAKIISDDISAYDYLTHFNEPSKYQYSADLIYKYNFKDIEECEQDNNGYDILELLLKGFPLRLIAKRYGKDFIYHYTAYRALMEDINFFSDKEGNSSVENLEQTTFLSSTNKIIR